MKIFPNISNVTPINVFAKTFGNFSENEDVRFLGNFSAPNGTIFIKNVTNHNFDASYSQVAFNTFLDILQYGVKVVLENFKEARVNQDSFTGPQNWAFGKLESGRCEELSFFGLITNSRFMYVTAGETAPPPSGWRWGRDGSPSSLGMDTEHSDDLTKDSTSFLNNVKKYLHSHSYLITVIKGIDDDIFVEKLTQIEIEYLNDVKKDVFAEWDGTQIGWADRDLFNAVEGRKSGVLQLHDKFYRRPILIIEVLIYRLYVYYLNKYYPDKDTFINKSNRQLEYFEYRGPELKNYYDKEYSSNLINKGNYGELFNLRVANLYVTDDIVVPIMYQYYKTFNEYKRLFGITRRSNQFSGMSDKDILSKFDYINGGGLKFDLHLLKKNTKINYVNYNEPKGLALCLISKCAKYTNPDGDVRQTSIYFYIPFEALSTKWQLREQVEYIPFLSDIYNTLPFIMKYNLWNCSGTHNMNPSSNTGFNSNEICQVIKSSGLTINNKNFPLTYKVINGEGRDNPIIGKRGRGRPVLSTHNYLQLSKYNTITSSNWQVNRAYKLLLYELWVKQTNSQQIMSRLGLKTLLVSYHNEEDEWNQICSIIGRKNYGLEQLRLIARKKLKLGEEKANSLSRRELCYVLAKYTAGRQRNIARKWANIHSKYPIPSGVCDNYDDNINTISDIKELEMKVFNRHTTQIIEEERDKLVEISHQKLSIPLSSSKELKLDDMKGWRALVQQINEKLETFSNSNPKSFIILVKPDLTSRCICVDTVKKSRDSAFCLWALNTPAISRRLFGTSSYELNPEETNPSVLTAYRPDPDGNNFIPAWKLQPENKKDEYREKTTYYALPFPIKEFVEYVGSKESIYLHGADLNKMLDQINRNKDNDKILVFYLGEVQDTGRMGRCEGGEGSSALHGQVHSNSALYNISYLRRINKPITKPINTPVTADEFVMQAQRQGEVREVNNNVRDKIKEIDAYLTTLQHQYEDLVTQKVTNSYGEQTSLAGYKYYHERNGWDVDQSTILEQLFGQNADEMKLLIDTEDHIEHAKRKLTITKMRLNSQLYNIDYKIPDALQNIKPVILNS